MVEAALERGERILGTVRSWNGTNRVVWTLTSRRLLMLDPLSCDHRLDAVPLDDVTNVDSVRCGSCSTLWVGTAHEVYCLDCTSTDASEAFAAELDALLGGDEQAGAA